MKRIALVVLVGLLLLESQAWAHKLIRPGPHDEIARDAFSASPAIEWNRLSGREGRYQETWTLDGDQLNKVSFFGGVPVDEPLFREEDKKRAPLPKVTAGMLITDIPVLLENSYRSQGRTSQMTIGRQEPAELDENRGIRFTYTYVFGDDQVERRGEALGAFVEGRLYLVTYEAPALYFFEKDIANFRQLVETLRINS